jgi:hypothetical protein
MKLRSRPPAVASAAQLAPLVADVTNWPLAYGLLFEKPVVAQLHVKAYVPVRAATARKTNAYRVPAVTVGWPAKVTVLSPPAAPSLNPGSVAEARSPPVGTPPEVARSEIVMFGFTPLQFAQNSSTSTRFSLPVTVGVNVWPAQLTLSKPNPVGLTFVFRASVLSGLARTTAPGLETRSQFPGVPRWKVLCELSVKQPLWAAPVSVKLCVALPPFGTAIVATEDVSKPSALAVSVGYVPAGTVNE